MDKQKVIETLASNDAPKKQFNVLLEHLMAHPHHPSGVARFLNARGYTPENLEMLKYDVMKTYEISKAAVSAFIPEQLAEEADIPLTVDDLIKDLLKTDIESLDYHKELKPVALALAESLGEDLPDLKKATLLDYLQSKKELSVKTIESLANEVANPYTEAPEEAKEGLKLRVEFPFLSEDDCPDKMKILVADKFTALEKYEAAHEQIQKMREAGETEGLFELGKKAVENWELNQLIYDELNYYNEHKELLGNHPIFEDDMLQKTVAAYTTQEAMKRQGNLRSYISRETPKLEKIEDKEKKTKIEAKLKVWQDELDLIDARLNADEKK